MGLATLWGIFWPLMQVMAGIAATVVLWLGGRQVLQGTMTLGEFVAFNGYLAMLTWPLMAIGYTANQYQRGTAALSRIVEVLDAPVSPRYQADAVSKSAAPVAGEIEFRNLIFTYDRAHDPVIKRLNLVIPAGTACGIIGETGSGKSTLVHLLLRLYEPGDGQIFIDGVDIKQMPRHALENATGHVGQDIFLFSGSVRENILLGSENGEADRLDEAARIAQLLPTIRSFNAGFDTVIGERGVRLSGGQKQRAALARAGVDRSKSRRPAGQGYAVYALHRRNAAPDCRVTTANLGGDAWFEFPRRRRGGDSRSGAIPSGNPRRAQIIFCG
jgi:ATP-binding cassette subfamily B protein